MQPHLQPSILPGHTQAAPAQRSRPQDAPCSSELDSISSLLTQKSTGHVSECSPPTRPLRASGSSGRHSFLVVSVLPKSGHRPKSAGMPPRDSLGMRHTLQAPPHHPAELTVVTHLNHSSHHKENHTGFSGGLAEGALPEMPFG